MRITDIMSKPAVTCPMSATLDQVARLMWEFDCGVVPVVDDEGRLSGIVTDRDVCMAAYTQGQAISAIPVVTAMAKHVVSVRGDESADRAEALMRDRQVRRLPVVDADRRPIGVVSMNDLARLAARTRKTATDREIVQTLAAICEPRAHMPLAASASTTRPALAG